MNSIPQIQEEARQLDRLAAQRQLYTTAKKISAGKIICGTVVGVGLALLVARYPELSGLKVGATLWGVIFTLADIVWLTPWERSLKKSAAAVQELFDCDVLQLAWKRKGEKVAPEVIARASRRHDRRANRDALKAWYPVAVGSLSLPLARIICQRASCRWDAELRNRYVICVSLFVAGILVLLLGFGIYEDLKLRDWLTGLALPLAPILVLGGRQIIENREAIETLNRLKRDVDKIWAEALQGASDSVLAEKSRDFQDDVWDQRAKSPLLFDWIYSRLKRDDEKDMKSAADDMIEQARTVGKT